MITQLFQMDCVEWYIMSNAIIVIICGVESETALYVYLYDKNSVFCLRIVQNCGKYSERHSLGVKTNLSLQ